MGLVSKWRNRNLPERCHQAVWIALLSFPALMMSLLLGSFRGMSGYFAGGYAGLTLTILTLVVVRVASARGDKE